MFRVHLRGIGRAVQGLDILVRSADDIAQPHVLLDGSPQGLRAHGVSLAVIDIVINDGSLLAGRLHEGFRLRRRFRIDGEKGAEQHHVAGVHRHLGHLEGLGSGVPEKLVVGVVLLIEHGHGDVALTRYAADSFGGQAVPRSEIRDDIGHGIVPDLGDHQ